VASVVRGSRRARRRRDLPCPRSKLRTYRRQALAIRWISLLRAAATDKTMFDRLSAELLDRLEQSRAAVKSSRILHRIAEANRAFVHYALVKRRSG